MKRISFVRDNKRAGFDTLRRAFHAYRYTALETMEVEVPALQSGTGMKSP